MSKYGSEFAKVWPTPETELEFTNFGQNLLKNALNQIQPKPLTFKEVSDNSKTFPVAFPINTCRIESRPEDRREKIEKFAASAYPLIHERVLWLYTLFIEHKTRYGTSIEKELYNGMSIIQFIQRLLDKRCASFFGKNDKFLLLSGKRGCSGFVEIGTATEKSPLFLTNCLSYDEMKLGALLSVSSFTDFINNGTRANCGVVETDLSAIERDGVIIGIVGARLSRRDLMEFQEIVISKTQNTPNNGYGKTPLTMNEELKAKYNYRQIWTNFYEENSLTFNEATMSNPRFGPSKNKDDFFDNLLMKKRYTISFDTLLLESEHRAKLSGKNGYIHVVGIGLGVWKACKHQEEIFFETFEQRIRTLLPLLNHISWIDFSYFHLDAWGQIKNNYLFPSSSHPNGGIRVFISHRCPADKLASSFKDPLLIVSYAWDGNALPGNEFWMGMLKSTGDSSTACSTLITELHNPHINKTMASGANVHIASEKYGILHINNYIRNQKFND